jgi:hypothetical protein
MPLTNDAEILEFLRTSVDRARGYADFFSYATDRDLEEWGVATALSESMHGQGTHFFSDVTSRGRPNDPPDCEVLDADGLRLAIGVTELVDGTAIQSAKRAKAEGRSASWADWPRAKFLAELNARLIAKDAIASGLKGGPYPAGFLVVVHTDEPHLTRLVVANHLADAQITKLRLVSRAFLMLSYDPSIQCCPCVELPIDG